MATGAGIGGASGGGADPASGGGVTDDGVAAGAWGPAAGAAFVTGWLGVGGLALVAVPPRSPDSCASETKVTRAAMTSPSRRPL